jgi:hypothetical protein
MESAQHDLKEVLMCTLFLATAFIAMPLCHTDNSVSGIRYERESKQLLVLSSKELDEIRGGQGFSFAATGGGAERVGRDPTVRDVALAQSVFAQQMDAWWADSGASLLAAAAR